eukprot:Gb_03468 [translate_table: standard]
MSEICYSHNIPVIDLAVLVDASNRARVIHQIRGACEEYGFFQIINHGVPERVMEDMMDVAAEFFEMPVQDRACIYSEDPKQQVRLFSSFNITKDKVLNWRDFLTHTCTDPLDELIGSLPEKPAAYREVAAKYSLEIRALALRLLAAISESLGLDSDHLNKIFGKHEQVMSINYYPPCPKPDLTLGQPAHSDPRAITILLQGDVGGLQVLKDGKWVAVEPIPNAFVVNVGDQLQVLSNGRFKSIEHRAVTNSTKARISIPTFYGPSRDAFMAPLASLVDDVEHPALYRRYKFQEFLDVFFSQGLMGKCVLEHFRMNIADRDH